MQCYSKSLIMTMRGYVILIKLLHVMFDGRWLWQNFRTIKTLFTTFFCCFLNINSHYARLPVLNTLWLYLLLLNCQLLSGGFKKPQRLKWPLFHHPHTMSLNRQNIKKGQWFAGCSLTYIYSLSCRIEGLVHQRRFYEFIITQIKSTFRSEFHYNLQNQGEIITH